MSESARIIFECEQCGTNFGIDVVSIGEDSNDDLCCPVCRGAKFGAVTRGFEVQDE